MQVRVFRPPATEADLIELARGCLELQHDDKAQDTRLSLTVKAFCNGYVSLHNEDPTFALQFQQRDFCQFLRFFLRHCERLSGEPVILPQHVLMSLERNFNGISQTKFDVIVKTMFRCLQTALADVKVAFPAPAPSLYRAPIEVLRSSLADGMLTVSFDSVKVGQTLTVKSRFQLESYAQSPSSQWTVAFQKSRQKIGDSLDEHFEQGSQIAQVLQKDMADQTIQVSIGSKIFWFTPECFQMASAANLNDNAVRFKLIVDPSEDESAARLLVWRLLFRQHTSPIAHAI
jgi:hypothetical protein